MSLKPHEWSAPQRILPAAKVEDFCVTPVRVRRLHTPDATTFRADFCLSLDGTFQNQRIHSAFGPTPLGPFVRPSSEPTFDPGVHTRLYRGRLDDDAILVSAIWPGLPRCGIWCFHRGDAFPQFGYAATEPTVVRNRPPPRDDAKFLVVPPREGTLYSYAAANPCAEEDVDPDGNGNGRWHIIFEGCTPPSVAGQPVWRLFHALWTPGALAVVDPEPICDGANPSLLVHEGVRYLYFSRLAPGGYAEGFETCAMTQPE